MGCTRTDCYYYGKSAKTCDYIIIVGISRNCPIDNCTKYTTTPPEKENKPGRLTKHQRDLAKVKFDLGLDDVEIARSIGADIDAVKSYRYLCDLDKDYRSILRGEEDVWKYQRRQE